mgnify:CR=1 FL=1
MGALTNYGGYFSGAFSPSLWPINFYTMNFLSTGESHLPSMWTGQLHHFAWYPKLLNSTEMSNNYQAGLANSVPVVWDSEVSRVLCSIYSI